MLLCGLGISQTETSDGLDGGVADVAADGGDGRNNKLVQKSSKDRGHQDILGPQKLADDD